MSGPSVVVAVFSAVFFTALVIACGAAMIAVHPVLAAVVNVIVAVGVAPSLWQWRAVPVWRWVVYGAVAGTIVSWIALLAGVR